MKIYYITCLICTAYLFGQTSLENFVYSFISAASIGVISIGYMFFKELKNKSTQ